MKTTKMRMAAAAASVALLVGGLSSAPASAEQRRVIVTLASGKQLTLMLDVPPGANIDRSMVPDLGAPIVSIVDGGPAVPPAATVTTPATTVPSTPTITTPPTIGTT